MKKEKGLVIRKVCVIGGITLLVAAIIMFVLWRWNISSSVKKAESYVNTLQELIPQPQAAVLEERRNNVMSVLSIDGTDFVGIVEIPRFNSVLPVGAEWGNSSKYPCRFSGSIYNGSLQIGATTQEGQYAFYRELSVGDEVIYTDMEGNQYTFNIKSIHTEKKVNQATLNNEEANLTLFIKNIYSFEYLVVFCDIQK